MNGTVEWLPYSLLNVIPNRILEKGSIICVSSRFLWFLFGCLFCRFGRFFRDFLPGFFGQFWTLLARFWFLFRGRWIAPFPRFWHFVSAFQAHVLGTKRKLNLFFRLNCELLWQWDTSGTSVLGTGKNHVMTCAVWDLLWASWNRIPYDETRHHIIYLRTRLTSAVDERDEQYLISSSKINIQVFKLQYVSELSLYSNNFLLIFVRIFEENENCPIDLKLSAQTCGLIADSDVRSYSYRLYIKPVYII